MITIIQTRINEEERQKYPDRIRYWPLKQIYDLKNRVRPGELEKEEEEKEDTVPSEKPKSTGEYEVKKRGAKNQVSYTELHDEPDSRQKSALVAQTDLPEYEVEEIIDKKVVKHNSEELVTYKVLWKGYPPEEATWEDASNMGNCSELIQEFERKRRRLT